MREMDRIDLVVRDVDPACLFDFFLKMNGTKIVLVLGFKDYLFSC